MIYKCEFFFIYSSYSKSTFVSVFMIKRSWRFNGEDNAQMYSKHLNV